LNRSLRGQFAFSDTQIAPRRTQLADLEAVETKRHVPAPGGSTAVVEPEPPGVGGSVEDFGSDPGRCDRVPRIEVSRVVARFSAVERRRLSYISLEMNRIPFRLHQDFNLRRAGVGRPKRAEGGQCSVRMRPSTDDELHPMFRLVSVTHEIVMPRQQINKCVDVVVNIRLAADADPRHAVHDVTEELAAQACTVSTESMTLGPMYCRISSLFTVDSALSRIGNFSIRPASLLAFDVAASFYTSHHVPSSSGVTPEK